MTNYRNGYELERAAKQLLEQSGWFVVRAGGSKGAADLVALDRGPGSPLLVQCKLDGYVPPAERRALAELAGAVWSEALIASWHKEGRTARRVKFVNTDGEEWKP